MAVELSAGRQTFKAIAMFISRYFLAVITLCFLSSVHAAEGDQWASILAGEHRSQKHMARDVYRHPKQTLTFFGVKPSSVVVEIWPGGSAWYTEVLAPLLKDNGLLYAAHFDVDSSVSYYRSSRKKFDAKLIEHPEVYGAVVTTTLMPPKAVDIAPANSADFVLTFRNVHNWMNSDNQAQVFASMFQALKPGGVLGVVEHRAKPGLSFEQMIESGYVTEQTVIDMAVAAGFKLLDKSEVNANPKDSTVHPKGVWTLPPSLRLGDSHRDKYLAIGESDRMTLKFIKPVK